MKQKKQKITRKNNPPCEKCGTRKYTYEELFFVGDDAEDRRPEYRGYYICPDCVFKSFT